MDLKSLIGLDTLMAIFGSVALVLAMVRLCEIKNAKIEPLDHTALYKRNLITNLDEVHPLLKKLSERVSYNCRTNFMGFLVWLFTTAFLITFIVYRTQPAGS